MIQFDSRSVEEAITGGGIVAMAAARYMPFPVESSIYYAWLFDTIQSLAHNPDRIGKRRQPITTQLAVEPQKAV